MRIEPHILGGESSAMAAIFAVAARRLAETLETIPGPSRSESRLLLDGNLVVDNIDKRFTYFHVNRPFAKKLLV